MKLMRWMGLGAAALAGLLAEGAFAARIELNDGWKCTRNESLPAAREFSIPAMLDALDGQRRDLVETPAASAVRVGRTPGAGHPFLRAELKAGDGWEAVRVPHDGGIDFAFSPDLQPLDGFLPGHGTLWYRLAFSVRGGRLKVAGGTPGRDELAINADGRLFFDCDGAMAFPMLWLNGQFVGGWPNGYMPWRVDLTPFLKDGENVLSVRTYRPPEYARWHTGMGLTRRCWLESVAKDHVVPDSVRITTPDVTKARATVKVVYEMSVSGRKEKTLTVENPRLWDIDDPHLYTVDVEGTAYRYGIRTIAWTADDGFHLNGRRVTLKGFCFHQDLCSLGAVANRTAIRRRLEKAKALGMNAVRMSHYPHAADWYELCDEMGLLVMDELTDAWELPKLYNDYHRLFPRWHERDLRTFIRRHRNHPSIVIWSLGNEIWESRSGEQNWPMYQRNGVEMVRLAHQEDPTRPTVTANDNKDVWRSPLAQFADVWGFNYRPECYAEYHARNPGRPIVVTEAVCTQTSRGAYFFHPDFGTDDARTGLPRPGRTYVDDRCNAYGFHAITPVDYEWAMQDASPSVAGSFSWTAFDYFGSPMILTLRGRRPYYSDPVRQAQADAELRRYGRARGGIHSCPTGVFDLAGFAKDEAYLYLSRWRPDVPTVHILPHWDWDRSLSVQEAPSGRPPKTVPNRVGLKTPVFVCSSGDAVELFVNGESQGRKAREKGLARFRFNDVVYRPGMVRAVAYRGGKVWGEASVKTTGAPARLVVTPERPAIAADGEDVGYVTVKVVDGNGSFCPTANLPVSVAVSGAGAFVAAENGDETDFTWLRDPTRTTYNGLLSVLVRAKPGVTGAIDVTVSSEGLPPATARVAVGGTAR